jgi:hypothetical protein
LWEITTGLPCGKGEGGGAQGRAFYRLHPQRPRNQQDIYDLVRALWFDRTLRGGLYGLRLLGMVSAGDRIAISRFNDFFKMSYVVKVGLT